MELVSHCVIMQPEHWANGWAPWYSQAELKEKLTKMYDVRDINSVFVFGFRNQVASRMRGQAVSLLCCPGQL